MIFEAHEQLARVCAERDLLRAQLDSALKSVAIFDERRKSALQEVSRLEPIARESELRWARILFLRAECDGLRERAGLFDALRERIKRLDEYASGWVDQASFLEFDKHNLTVAIKAALADPTVSASVTEILQAALDACYAIDGFVCEKEAAE